MNTKRGNLLHTARLGEFAHWESLNMSLWFTLDFGVYTFGGKFTICAWINFWVGGIQKMMLKLM